jgi:hypothetical protein
VPQGLRISDSHANAEDGNRGKDKVFHWILWIRRAEWPTSISVDVGPPGRADNQDTVDGIYALDGERGWPRLSLIALRVTGYRAWSSDPSSARLSALADTPTSRGCMLSPKKMPPRSAKFLSGRASCRRSLRCAGVFLASPIMRRHENMPGPSPDGCPCRFRRPM